MRDANGAGPSRGAGIDGTGRGPAPLGVLVAPGVRVMQGAMAIALAGLAQGCLDDELDSRQGFRLDVASEQGPVDEQADEDQSGAGDAGTDDRQDPFSTDAGDAGRQPPTPAQPELSVFIALERDFGDFLSWTTFDLGEGTHVSDRGGAKRVYINWVPQPGDSEFRIGTVIVKTLALTPSMSGWQVHAMVKRGAGYNERGAFGWEYFDLALSDEGEPTLTWRGEQPPDGESYGVTQIAADGNEIVVEQDCNDCHQSANNDAVLTPQLDLERY